MGKLLQKLVHGLAPSWLTKIKSANPSPRRSLPFFKAGATPQPSSDKPPSSSTSPTPSNSTGVFDLAQVDEATQQDERSSVGTSPRLSPMRQETEAEKDDSNDLQHEKSLPEYSVHEKEFNHQFFDQCKEDHGISPKQSESPSLNANLDIAAPQPAGSSCEEALKPRTELHQFGQNGKSHEAQLHNSGYYEGIYREVLGFKRKSHSLEVELADNEDGDEELEGIISASGNIKRWAWKRMKAEKGVLSCELPESICSIIGNGRAVVKQSLDPQHALWESMVEMIVGNGLHELGNLEFLLYCYLSLNEPHLYPIIQASFLQVLKDLERIE